MFTPARIALSAAIVLSTAFPAAAATKAHVTRVDRAAASNVIPGYDKDGNTVALPDPDGSADQFQR